MLTEKEKMLQGKIYDANGDSNLIQERKYAKSQCFAFNQLPPDEADKSHGILKSLLGKTGSTFEILPTFNCDYGYNIELGENFFSNHNLIILDCAKVTFGDNVFIAPNCAFYTAGHPIDVTERNKGLEYAYPITVGNNVWIGGNVCVMPGVTIGDNTVIGGGSVVTKDIPSNVIAAGNPCRVIKSI